MKPWRWLRAAFGGDEGAREAQPRASGGGWRYGLDDRLVPPDEMYLGGLGGGRTSYLTGGQFGGFGPAQSTYVGRVGDVIPAMQAAVSLIARTLACCPRTVVGATGRPVAHDAERLMNHSDRRFPASAVWEYLIRSSLVWGWGLAWAPRIPAAGGRIRLYPCDPIHSTVSVDDDNRALTFDLHPIFGPRRTAVPGRDVLVIAGDGWNGLRGLSPLLAYAATTGVLRSTHNHLWRTLTQGMHVSGVVEVGEGVGQEMGWDLPRLAELRKKLAEQFAGERKAGQAPVLPPGFTWKPVPFNAVDIELVKLLELSIEDVCRIYDVPPRKIFHFRSGIRYPASVESSNAEWTASLRLRTDLLADQIGSQLLSPMDREGGLAVRIDPEWVAAGTLSERIAAMDQAVARTGVMTPNEGRVYISTGTLPRLDALPDGDRLLAPKGGPGENASGMESPGATEAGEETEPTEAGE